MAPPLVAPSFIDGTIFWIVLKFPDGTVNLQSDHLNPFLALELRLGLLVSWAALAEWCRVS